MIKINDNELIIEWSGKDHILAKSEEDFLKALDNLISMVCAGGDLCLVSSAANAENLFSVGEIKLSMSYVDGKVVEIGMGDDKFTVAPDAFKNELAASLKEKEDELKSRISKSINATVSSLYLDAKFGELLEMLP